jgi:hypothetical protein
VYGVSRDEVVMDADGCVCVYIGVEGAYVLDGHVFTGDIDWWFNVQHRWG